MNWDLIKSYYPNPERAKEYYLFVEEMRMMVGGRTNFTVAESAMRTSTIIVLHQP